MVGCEYSSSLGIVGDYSSVCVVDWNSAACVKGERLSGRVVRKREPIFLKCSEGPVTVSSRSSSICVEGRARQ